MPDLDQPDASPQMRPPLPSWADALATARPGFRYRISGLLFSMVRDRCRDLGLEQGDEVTCIEAGRWSICVERLDGRRVTLERDYAWFVQVEALATPVAQATRFPHVSARIEEDDSDPDRVARN